METVQFTSESIFLIVLVIVVINNMFIAYYSAKNMCKAWTNLGSSGFDRYGIRFVSFLIVPIGIFALTFNPPYYFSGITSAEVESSFKFIGLIPVGVYIVTFLVWLVCTRIQLQKSNSAEAQQPTL